MFEETSASCRYHHKKEYRAGTRCFELGLIKPSDHSFIPIDTYTYAYLQVSKYVATMLVVGFVEVGIEIYIRQISKQAGGEAAGKQRH
jgi:hypothetical protein